MGRIKKTSPKLNLTKFQTFLVDTQENSEYFKLSEVPEQLTSGKNGFLIEGSIYLKPTTEIKIEILDTEGNPLFVEPGEGIPEYYEGLSKLISVHVYEDTPIGVGKITILGELENYLDENGFVQRIPEEWKGIYNIKWEKDIKINKNLLNETKVRFLKRPEVIIEELGESFYSEIISSGLQTNGTVEGIAIIPEIGTNLNNYAGGIIYHIKNKSVPFVDGGISISIPGTQIQSASILEYINQYTLVIRVPHTSSLGIVSDFSSKNYALNYQYVSSITESPVFGSFARFEINNLATFVGDVERIKLYGKSKATTADYNLLFDSRIGATNLLNTIISGSTIDRGFFSASYGDSRSWNTYWTTQSLSGISSATLDTNDLYKSVKFKNYKIKTNVGNDIRLERGSEYTLEFYVFYSTPNSNYTPNKNDTLKIYASSSPRTTGLTSVYVLTSSLDELVGDNKWKQPTKVTYNFIPDITDNWNINFEGKNEDLNTYWQIGSVKLYGSSELGYSPDEYGFTIPIERKLEQETYDFRLEYFDLNNNFVPVDNTATQTFVSGNISLLDKSIDVSLDKSFFTFYGTSVANPDPQTINISINKNKILGNLLITSQAFDTGGNAIPTSVYAGYNYPGKFTNYTETLYFASASLLVADFTGALHNVPPTPGTQFVDRITYTITETLSLQPAIKTFTISRLKEGDGGVSFLLTKEAVTFTADSTGVVTSAEFDKGDGQVSGSYGNSQIVFDNSLITPNSFKILSFTTSNCTANAVSPTSAVYGISSMTGDSATLTINLRYLAIDGVTNIDFSKTVNYTKAKKSAPVLELILSPKDQSITAKSTGEQIGNLTDVIATVTQTYDGISTTLTPSVTANTDGSTIFETNQIIGVSSNTILLNAKTILDAVDSGIVKVNANVTDAESQLRPLTGSLSLSKVKKAAPVLSITSTPKDQSVSAKSTGQQIDSFSNVSVSVKETYNGVTTTLSLTSLTAVSADIASIVTNSGTGTITLNGRTLANGTNSTTVTITGIVTDSEGVSRTLTDTLALSKIKKAAPAITYLITPQAQSVASNYYGTLTGTITDPVLTIFEGVTPLTYNQGVLSDSQYKITNVTGVTVSDTTPNTSTIDVTAISSIDNTGVVSYEYKDSEGSTGTGTIDFKITKVPDGVPAVQIEVSPASQVVGLSETLIYDAPTSFRVKVYIDGVALSYQNPLSSANTFLVDSISGGSITSTGADYVDITPTTPVSPTGTTTTFNVSYRNATNVTAGPIPQSHKVSVVADGITGPGIVFTGLYDNTRAYQFSSGVGGRRDVVLWSAGGSPPYDTYYATKATPPVGTPPTNTTYWESLGTEDYFVAAKIAIFEDSFIKNTLNVGSSNNGGLSSANITLNGGDVYPYISLGQSAATGSQEFGVTGIFLGRHDATKNSDAINGAYVFSLVGNEGFLKWDGSQLLISGNLSASIGNIGGVTIGKDKLYLGAGNYANTNTGFFVSASGDFSLKDSVVWNNTDSLFSITKGSISIGTTNASVTTINTSGQLVTQNADIRGTINATAGNIGGWSIGTNNLQASSSQGTIRLDRSGPSIAIYSGSSQNPAVDINTRSQLSGTGSVSIGITGSSGTIATTSQISSTTMVASSNGNAGTDISSRYSSISATYISGSRGTRYTSSYSASFSISAADDNKFVVVSLGNIGSSGALSASFAASVDPAYTVSTATFTLEYGFALYSGSSFTSGPDIFIDAASKVGSATNTFANSFTTVLSNITYSGNLSISKNLKAGNYHVVPFIELVNISATAQEVGGGCGCPEDGTFAYYGGCPGGLQEYWYYNGTCDGSTGTSYNGCDVYLVSQGDCI